MVGERILGSTTYALQASGLHSRLYYGCIRQPRSASILISGSEVGGLVESISILDLIVCRVANP